MLGGQYIAVIFYRSSPQESAPGFSEFVDETADWRNEQVHPLEREQPGKLWAPYFRADQQAHAADCGIVHTQITAGGDNFLPHQHTIDLGGVGLDSVIRSQ